MTSTNPFDQMQVRDDVIRYEYAEKLFELMRDVLLQIRAEWDDESGATQSEQERMAGKQAGLQLAMDLLDEEMGRLSTRWQ